MSRPTELAITIAALPAPSGGAFGGWVYADEVRGRLRMLGFDCTGQFVAAALARMAATDAPWVERKANPLGGPWKYRVTRYGSTDIDNRMPLLRVRAPWLEAR
jgi:hypothetical protein